MTCLGDEERINRYLDDDLNPEERAQFEAHLSDCPACRRALARQRALFALLDGLAEAPVPADLREAVLAGLPRRRAAPLGRWLLMAQAAATVALLALAWPTLRRLYVQWTALLPPGWLTALAAEAFARFRETIAWFQAALTVEVHLALVPRLGLTWSQMTLAVGALIVFWLLGNHLLLGRRGRSWRTGYH